MRSLSQSIKNFGRKLFLTSALIGVLGYTSSSQNKKSYIFKDINNDGKPDLIYLVLKKSDLFRPLYSLVLRYGTDKGFSAPLEIENFIGKPEEIQLEDVNNDGKVDLVYLIESNPGNYDSTSDLVVRYGKGNGTFKEPEILRREKTYPIDLH
ncbi:MAG: VCBS repeat-containing protein [Nanoarchaeota archaeon]